MATLLGMANTMAAALPVHTRLSRQARGHAVSASSPVAREMPCQASCPSLQSSFWKGEKAISRPLVALNRCQSKGGSRTRVVTSAKKSDEFKQFKDLAKQGYNAIPIFRKIFSDQLTPVVAYRCLVADDDRESPSFLLESVVGGDKIGQFSFVGRQPHMEVVATGSEVSVLDHLKGTRQRSQEADPMEVAVRLSKTWKAAHVDGLPKCFTGGWVGFSSYDTVRYVEGDKIPFSSAPVDDRNLPDLHLGLYKDVAVFDNISKVVFLVHWALLTDDTSPEDAYAHANEQLDKMSDALQFATRPPLLAQGTVGMATSELMSLADRAVSTMSKEQYMGAVEVAKEHIRAGDIFQVVLSHRFERRTFADPFEIYRALRIVNPSPYMIYMQGRGAILVASSPEILCRVADGVMVNRPLAGTRTRGATPEADLALEKELLADEKEIAEHVMLVDLGRNDVGKVSRDGSVVVQKLMEIERYSHVMHISSTVTGSLKDGLTCWDALRAALPAGTVSGAPKVRAMQIIDDLEATRRGPYGGGIGFASFTGNMDMALALRTMVIPTAANDTMLRYDAQGGVRREWAVHLQAGAGIVADSVPEKEYEETVNKASALARAIDLAENAFLPKKSS
eukprot:jgi/Mesvir1/12300/Mv00502-RA.1